MTWFKDLSFYVRVHTADRSYLKRLRISPNGQLYVSMYRHYELDDYDLLPDGKIKDSSWWWEPALAPKCTCCRRHCLKHAS